MGSLHLRLSVAKLTVIDSGRLESVLTQYRELSRKAKVENRFIFNHVCIRTERIGEAADLLEKSFGLPAFLSPGGQTFEEERGYQISWLEEQAVYLELSEFDRSQSIGYDTGVGQPIGHLSEVGFFVPGMDTALQHLLPLGWSETSRIETTSAVMVKIYNTQVPGLPVELIDIIDLDVTDFLS